MFHAHGSSCEWQLRVCVMGTFSETHFPPHVLRGPETLKTDEGSACDSSSCPLPPTGETVHAVHWDVPCVWAHSREELATLQGVYPEGPGQESGELAAGPQGWVAAGAPGWLGAGGVSANLWDDGRMAGILAP